MGGSRISVGGGVVLKRSEKWGGGGCRGHLYTLVSYCISITKYGGKLIGLLANISMTYVF